MYSLRRNRDGSTIFRLRRRPAEMGPAEAWRSLRALLPLMEGLFDATMRAPGAPEDGTAPPSSPGNDADALARGLLEEWERRSPLSNATDEGLAVAASLRALEPEEPLHGFLLDHFLRDTVARLHEEAVGEERLRGHCAALVDGLRRALAASRSAGVEGGSKTEEVAVELRHRLREALGEAPEPDGIGADPRYG